MSETAEKMRQELEALQRVNDGEKQRRQEDAEEAERMRRAEIEAVHESQQNTLVATARDIGVISTEPVESRAVLRIYTHHQSVLRQHSFLVGNEQGGLSEKIGRIPINANITTLRQLRPMIETVVDDNMIRRNPIYQEFMALVFSLANPYKYPDMQLRRYRFAFFASPQDKIPTLIPEEAEEGLLVRDSVVNMLTDDLILVPQSQIRPDGAMPSSEEHATGREEVGSIALHHHGQSDSNDGNKTRGPRRTSSD